MNSNLKNFAEDFERIETLYVNRVALVDSNTNEETKFGDLRKKSLGLAEILRAQGLKPGDVVASLIPGGPLSVICFIGVTRSGHQYLPLSCQSTKSELQRAFRLLKPSALLCLEDRQKDHEFVQEVPSGTKIIRLNLEDLSSSLGTSCEKGLKAGKLLIATSGSTGLPKIIRISMDRLWTSAVSFSSHHQFLDENCRFFNFYPMSYLAGTFNLTLIPYSVGASSVLGEGFTGISLMKFWTTVRRFGINVLWFSPTVLHGLAKMAKSTDEICPLDLAKSIRAGFLGMGPIRTSEKVEYERRLGFSLLENYGLSETTFISSETLNTRFKRIEASIGEVLPWVNAHVKPETGELEIKTPFLAEGEVVEDEIGMTREKVFDLDTYWGTGDIIEVSGDRLVYKGRTKNIIKKGGYLISLDEIDRALEEVPQFIGAMSVGMSHPLYGECVTVCVPSREKAAGLSMRRHLAEKLARYKWPSFLMYVDGMPLTHSGKPDRKALQSKALDAALRNELETF